MIKKAAKMSSLIHLYFIFLDLLGVLTLFIPELFTHKTQTVNIEFILSYDWIL